MNLIKITLPIPTHQHERTIRILLPDHYDESNKDYPVIYMHDGQNLFEDETSYSGHSWGIKETLYELKIDDVIIVGIDNSELRLFEYAPWACVDMVKDMTKITVGGYGDPYATWVTEFLKPYIDAHYRTQPDVDHTFVAGSSMGAYISVYMGQKYPEVYGGIGCFSLASWFNEKDFLDYILNSKTSLSQRYFISVGRHETSNPQNTEFSNMYIENSQNLKRLLHDKGIEDIYYIETDDKHHELAWRKVFKDFITYILKK